MELATCNLEDSLFSELLDYLGVKHFFGAPMPRSTEAPLPIAQHISISGQQQLMIFATGYLLDQAQVRVIPVELSFVQGGLVLIIHVVLV